MKTLWAVVATYILFLLVILVVAPSCKDWTPGIGGNHAHAWTNGPYWITVAMFAEEPDETSASGQVKLEHCKICGFLRIVEPYRDYVGKNLAEGKEE